MTLTPDSSIADTVAPLPGARRSLTAQLVDALRMQIESRELRAGSRIATEAEMVQRFGVSRTVVREALSRLQAAGLVETRHGIGTFVCEASAALSDFAQGVGTSDGTVSPDFRFHLEIAHATGNRYFVEIMEHLGMRMFPRTRLTATPIPQDQYADYLLRVNREARADRRHHRTRRCRFGAHGDASASDQ